MEVHHHPKVEKKNFKEYFLEFLMIFLAVTLGFIAENIRETNADRGREKEFMKSMVEDLKSDTANINSFNTKANVVLTQADSLMLLIRSADRSNYGTNMYYYARVITTGLGRFVLSDRTFEEMKSSGSLRLVNDDVLSDSVSKYYAAQSTFKEQAQLQIDKMNTYGDYVIKLFDGAVFQQMLQRFPYKVNPPNSNPSLLTNDAATINEFVGALHYFSAIIVINASRARQKEASATQLIQMIQSKYHVQ